MSADLTPTPPPSLQEQSNAAIASGDRVRARDLLSEYLYFNVGSKDVPPPEDQATGDRLATFLGHDGVRLISAQLAAVATPTLIFTRYPHAFGVDGDVNKIIHRSRIAECQLLLLHLGKALTTSSTGAHIETLSRENAIHLQVTVSKVHDELEKIARLNRSFGDRGLIAAEDASKNAQLIDATQRDFEVVALKALHHLEHTSRVAYEACSSGDRLHFLLGEYKDHRMPDAIKAVTLVRLTDLLEELASDDRELLSIKLAHLEAAYTLLATKERRQRFPLPSMKDVEAALARAVPLVKKAIFDQAPGPELAQVAWATALERIFFFPELRREGSTFPDLLRTLIDAHRDVRHLDPELGLRMEGNFVTMYSGSDTSFLASSVSRFERHLRDEPDKAIVARVALSLLDVIETKLRYDDQRVTVLARAALEAFDHLAANRQDPRPLMGAFAKASQLVLGRSSDAKTLEGQPAPLTTAIVALVADHVGREMGGSNHPTQSLVVEFDAKERPLRANGQPYKLDGLGAGSP